MKSRSSKTTLVWAGGLNQVLVAWAYAKSCSFHTRKCALFRIGVSARKSRRIELVATRQASETTKQNRPP